MAHAFPLSELGQVFEPDQLRGHFSASELRGAGLIEDDGSAEAM